MKNAACGSWSICAVLSSSVTRMRSCSAKSTWRSRPTKIILVRTTGSTSVLNFWLNKYFYVSLAEKSARPLRNAVKKMIVPPDSCCFANWLRNHDELDLEGIGKKAKQTVIDAFAPDKEMSVYQRGIRRRLAPMLNGDRKRLAFCHAVLFSLPGVPVMRYGDEIGMGDDLELEERYAVRTPMQWAGSQGGGFSDADPETFIAPMIDRGPYRYQKNQRGGFAVAPQLTPALHYRYRQYALGVP